MAAFARACMTAKFFTYFLIATVLLCVHTASARPRLVAQTGHTGSVKAVAFSPDGKVFASAGEDASVRLWDVETGALLRVLHGLPAGAASVVFSPDGSRVAAHNKSLTRNTRLVMEWDPRTGRVIAAHKVKDWEHQGATNIESLAYWPDGKFLVAATAAGQAFYIVDTETGKMARKLGKAFDFFDKSQDIWSGIKTFAIAPNGRFIVSGHLGKKVKLWDVETGSVVRTFEKHGDDLESVALSPDGKIAASSSSDGDEIKLWVPVTGKAIAVLNGPRGNAKTLVFTTNGNFLVSAHHRDICVWDIETGEQVRTIQTNGFPPGGGRFIAVSPDGRKVAVAGRRNYKEGNLFLFDLHTGEKLVALAGKSEPVKSIAISPDGSKLAYVRGDSRPEMLNFKTGLPLFTVKRDFQSNSLAFSHKGDALYAAKGTIEKYDPETGERISEFDKVEKGVGLMTVIPDGRILSAAENTATLWDPATGKPVQSFSGHTDEINAVTAMPSGKHFLTGGQDAQIKMWDASTGKEVRSFKFFNMTRTSNLSPEYAQDHPVIALAVSPDGKTLAAGGWFARAERWDIASGKRLPPLGEHGPLAMSMTELEANQNRVSVVSYSSDGKYVATGSNGADRPLLLWDGNGRRFVRGFQGHAFSINTMTFTPEGRYLLAGGKDGELKLWLTETGALAATLVVFDDKTFGFFTPDGRFGGKPGVEKNFRIVDGFTVMPVDDAYKAKNYLAGGWPVSAKPN